MMQNEEVKQRYFIGSTDKDALSYQIGEEMRFSLTLVCGKEVLSVPQFRYTCQSDDGKEDSGCKDGKNGTFTYTTSISRAGYLHLTVTACDETGEPLAGYDVFEGGACAGFEEIRPHAAAPEDFDAFWQQVIQTELDPVSPTVLSKKEVPCEDEDSVVYDIQIACPGENPVSGYLRLPRNAAYGSLPIRIRYMGHNVSPALIPPKENAIGLCVNQHGSPNDRDEAYYHDMLYGPLAMFGFDKEQNKDPHTVYFKYMILRALQAVRYCKTLPEWDGIRIEPYGDSMGAFQSTSVAAFSHDVTKLSIGIPWLCDLRGIEEGRLGGWRPAPDHGIDYYDTVFMAQRVQCPVEIRAGLGDYVCPPSGVTALYHSIKTPKKLTMLQNKTHPYDPPTGAEYTR